MRFLSFEIARSGFSLRLSFTVSIWSILGWCVPAAVQQLVLFFLYTSIVPRPVEFVKWPGVWTQISQLIGVYGVLRRAVGCRCGGALMCVGYGVGGGELSSGGLR